MRDCIVCGRPFERARHKICSDECRRRRAKEYMARVYKWRSTPAGVVSRRERARAYHQKKKADPLYLVKRRAWKKAYKKRHKYKPSVATRRRQEARKRAKRKKAAFAVKLFLMTAYKKGESNG